MRRRTFSILLATAAIHAGAGAGTRSAHDALRDWLEGSRTLEARFEQTLVSGALGTGLVETGRIALERPGRIRWDYEKPEKKLALLLDGRTFLYLPEERQLLRGRLEDDSLIPRLLAGGPAFEEAFETREEGGAGGGTTRLRLSPRGGGAELSEALLTVRLPEGSIEEAEIVDAAGNRIRYAFSGWKRNRKIAAGTFVFEPPPGTEVVELD